MNKKFKTIIIDNFKTLSGALIIAILIRSLFFNRFIFLHHQWSQPYLMEIDFLYQNILMVTVNIHFHLVLNFKKEFF